MFESMPPWFRKALGGYLRAAIKWADSNQLEKILIFYFGVTPPPGQAKDYALALAQKLAPLGRPRKESRQWKQLELNLENQLPHKL